MRWSWRRRHTKTKQCEVCGQWFRPTEVVEITDAGLDATEFGMGGWSITATFCRKDAPKEAAA